MLDQLLLDGDRFIVPRDEAVPEELADFDRVVVSDSEPDASSLLPLAAEHRLRPSSPLRS